MKNLTRLLTMLLIHVIVGSSIVNAQSSSSKGSRDRVTAIKSKLPQGDQDLPGQLLTKALNDLEHCINLSKLKGEQITALESNVTALKGQLQVEENRVAELRKANEARREADQLNDERFKLQEARITLYKNVIDDYEAEVKKLRAKKLWANLWGNAKVVMALTLGVVIGVAASK